MTFGVRSAAHARLPHTHTRTHLFGIAEHFRCRTRAIETPRICRMPKVAPRERAATHTNVRSQFIGVSFFRCTNTHAAVHVHPHIHTLMRRMRSADVRNVRACVRACPSRAANVGRVVPADARMAVRARKRARARHQFNLCRATRDRISSVLGWYCPRRCRRRRRQPGWGVLRSRRMPCVRPCVCIMS